MKLIKNIPLHILGEYLVSPILKSDELYSILNNSKVKSGPFDGGSLILARAFQQVLGGSYVYLEKDNDPINTTRHYGLKLDNNIYLDGDGYAVKESIWVKRFAYEEMISHKLIVKNGIHPQSVELIDEDTSNKIVNLMLNYWGLIHGSHVLAS